jgi:N-acetylglucosamine-6-phosphate deacetylase
LLRGLSAVAEVIECPDKYGAEILGIHLEGPYLSSSAKGAQAVSNERTPSMCEMENIWKASKGYIIRWDAAPELDNIGMFANWLNKKGVLASIAHSSANAEIALNAMKQGFTHITHLYCSTTTEHKEGQNVCGGIIEAAYLNDDCTVEIIGDGRHIPKETMQLVFKLKGSRNTALITDAMRAAGESTENHESILGDLKFGTHVIIEDGVAKLKDRSSFAGSITTMDKVLKNALDFGIPFDDAVTSVSITPASIIGVQDRKGSLEIGKDADIVIADKDILIKNVFTKGNSVKGVDQNG